jgi:2-polyprenyl-3-methyl-5-hydroxy-6-metoxy-1,4-benzoquinol methylase
MFSDPGKVIEQLYVGEGMTVADFGAGIGFYALQLARRVGPYGRVFAIDVQPDSLRRIKNEATKSGMNQLEVIQGDLESYKGSGLVSASVDRIVIANVLFQADHPEMVVKEAKRILKHNGKIAVVEWVDSYGQIGPHKDHILSQEDARVIFEQNGFVLESFIDAGSHHYGLLYTHAPTPVPGEERNMAHRPEEEINPSMVIAPEELRNNL